MEHIIRVPHKRHNFFHKFVTLVISLKVTSGCGPALHRFVRLPNPSTVLFAVTGKHSQSNSAGLAQPERG